MPVDVTLKAVVTAATLSFFFGDEYLLLFFLAGTSAKLSEVAAVEDTFSALTGDFAFVATGSGFTYDSNGVPKTGTITTLVVKQSGVEIARITGNIPVAELYAGDYSLEKLLASDDTITGSPFGDPELMGYDGNDVIDGGAGDDGITGGKGADDMTGGLGADTFDINGKEESGKKPAKRDEISDFENGVDTLDLSTIDAKPGKPGDDKFKFIGKKDFRDKEGDLRFEKQGDDIVVYGDINGDGKPDFSILLAGISSIAKADIEL